MEFHVQKSYGYPVLREGSDDYDKGAIQFTVRPLPRKPNDSIVVIKYKFSLSIEQLTKRILSGDCCFAVVIECRDAFLRQVYEFSEFEGELNCDADLFRGRIKIEAYVIAKRNINDYKCHHVNEEFGEGPFSFNEGAILAQCRPELFHVINEKYKTIQSLIKLKTDSSLSEGEWYFDIGVSLPTVYTSEKQAVFFSVKSERARAIMANTVLVPMVAKMIELIKDSDDTEEIQDFEWYKLVEEGLINKNLTIDSKEGDPLRLAQHFLDLPQLLANPLIDGE